LINVQFSFVYQYSYMFRLVSLPLPLRIQKIYHRLHNIPSVYPDLSQINPTPHILYTSSPSQHSAREIEIACPVNCMAAEFATSTEHFNS
jgi:hypothetical protein